MQNLPEIEHYKRSKTVRVKRLKRLRKLQSEELVGYRERAYARVQALPQWFVKTYRGILTGMVTMTMGIISSSPASAKAKTAVTQKDGKPEGSRSSAGRHKLTAMGTASVRILPRKVSLKMQKRGESPIINTKSQYNRIEDDTGNVTYNFK